MNLLDLPSEMDPSNILNTVDYEHAVNSISGEFEESIDTLVNIGREEFNKLDKPLSQQLIEIFEILMPGNGEIGAIFWASAVATAQGKPNMGIIKGNQGEGKSVLMDYILDFIPERHVEKINNATEAALFDNTMPMNYLDKKIIYLGDLGDKRGFESTLPARKVLRTLQTDGYFARNIQEKQKDENGAQNWNTIHQKLIGKPAMWFTTVREDADMQDQDRAIIATTNLNKADEIKYIIQHIGKNSTTGQKIKKTIEKWKPILHSIFEYLITQNVEAVIPYNLRDIKYKFRDLDRLITLSEMMATINQNYRPKYDNFIIVTKYDIKIIAKFINDGKGELSKIKIKRLNEVYDKFGDNKSFTREDIVSLFPDTYSSLQAGTSNVYRDILKPAIDAHFIAEDKSERPYIYMFLGNYKEELNKNQFTLDLPEIDEYMLKKEYGINISNNDLDMMDADYQNSKKELEL